MLLIEWCQANYKAKVRAYTCTFCKQERVNGKLFNPEKIEVHFNQEPFNVHMHFLEGDGQAQKVLYPYGKDLHRLLARPKGLAKFITVSKDINGADAKESSRFPVSEFGMGKAMDSTLASMSRAK